MSVTPAQPIRRLDRFLRTWLLSATFVIAICLPTVGLYFPLPDWITKGSEHPNRRTDVATGDMHHENDGVESFGTEHFAFRGLLTSCYGHIQTKVLGLNSSDSVLVGREGFLFLRETESVNDIRTTPEISVDQLKRWAEPFVRTHATLQSKGIPYLVVIAPDKHEIYPQYLPEWIGKPTSPTRLDRFVEFMKEHTNVPLLDPRVELRQLAQTHLAFSRTDTHWTGRGALVVSGLICQTLFEIYPDELASISASTVSRSLFAYSSYRGGDLSYMLGITDAYKEEIVDVSFSIDHMKADASTVFLDDIPWHQPVFDQKTLLLYHDSFGETLIPILQCAFQHIHGQRTYTPGHCTEAELSSNPDVVVQEICERYLWK